MYIYISEFVTTWKQDIGFSFPVLRLLSQGLILLGRRWTTIKSSGRPNNTTSICQNRYKWLKRIYFYFKDSTFPSQYILQNTPLNILDPWSRLRGRRVHSRYGVRRAGRMYLQISTLACSKREARCTMEGREGPPSSPRDSCSLHASSAFHAILPSPSLCGSCQAG